MKCYKFVLQGRGVVGGLWRRFWGPCSEAMGLEPDQIFFHLRTKYGLCVAIITLPRRVGGRGLWQSKMSNMAAGASLVSKRGLRRGCGDAPQGPFVRSHVVLRF